MYHLSRHAACTIARANATRSKQQKEKTLKETARRIGSWTLEATAELLWPTRCAVCDEEGSTLCEACAESLPYIDACRSCPQCGAPFGSIQCSECNPVMLKATSHDSLPFTQAASALAFDSVVKRIVSSYKDQGEQRLAKDMAAIMARYVPPAWLAEKPPVTYIPATKSAVNRRGFDHAALLARELSQTLELGCVSILTQPRSHDQRKLSRKSRQANMRDKFRLTPGATAPNAVLLIDDVCTTGATLYAASDALAIGGAKSIFCLTFARVW